MSSENLLIYTLGVTIYDVIWDLVVPKLYMSSWMYT